jgi:HJR/Mrr/RecB family endonuclease
MRVPERYREWPQFWPPKDLPLEDALRVQTWSAFEWRAHQIDELLETLRREIKIVRQAFNEEDDVYGNYDPDARSIARAWAGELAARVAEWCRFLDLDPHELPDYDTAERKAVRYTMVDPDPMVATLRRVLGQRHAAADLVFRPRCLELANRELMSWLARHPGDIDRVHHRTFEAIVAELVRDSGWSVELTKRTRDGGYDIVCLRTDVTGNVVKIVVETKLYGRGRTVGLLTVDRIMGAASRDGARAALVVTNSHFSADSWRRWEHRIGQDLALVDREELFLWLTDNK